MSDNNFHYSAGPTVPWEWVDGDTPDVVVQNIIDWFEDNYEDPTPNDDHRYNGIYIVPSGPFHAADEIRDCFRGVPRVTERVLEEAISILALRHSNWVPRCPRSSEEQP
jgi:hypothetical protein